MPPILNKTKTSLLFFYAFFLFIHSGFTQQNRIDSLVATLPIEKDTNYVLKLQKVIRQFGDRTAQMKYQKEALKLSEELDFVKGKATALYFIGKLQRRENKEILAIETLEQSIPLSKSINDQTLEFLAYLEIGQIYLRNGQSDLSYKNYLTALNIAETSQNKLDLADAHYRIGDFYRLQNDYEKAINEYEQAAVFYLELEKMENYCWLRSCIAMTYKHFDTIEKNQEGIDIYEEILNGECAEVGSLLSRAKHYNNLGSSYVSLGNLEKGEEVLNKALAMKREVGHKGSLAYTLNEIASLHDAKGNYQSSLDFSLEAYEILQEKDDLYLLQDVTRNLYYAYYNTGQYKEGIEKLKENHTVNDSILNLEKAGKIAEMSSKYNLEKKEKDLLQKDLLLMQQKSRFNMYLILGMSILGLVFGLFLWQRWRLNKEKLESKKLEELDQLKSNFFANITHEFRTPLTVILNSFANKKEEDGKVVLNNQEVEMIERNTNRLQGLINQLLDLTKLDAGKMKLQVVENDLLIFLKKLTASFTPLAVGKNIQLQFSSELSFCPAYFDPDKIEKIITNLIVNAIKFTPKNGSVDVYLKSKKDKVEIIIKDNGIGISKEGLSQIFNRFHQIDNSETRNFEGSGIGLALVDQMVRIHEGTIQVESTLGVGSIFTLQLPISKKHYALDQILEAPFVKIAETKQPLFEKENLNANNVDSKIKDDQRPILLIAEDDQDLRFLLKKQLKDQYQIIETSNGEEGVEMALDKIPDLIISDVMMPKLSGYELCKRIKEDVKTNHIPIILLTAKARQAEKLEGLEVGADSYLIKPFDPKELEIRIQNLIRQRKQLQERFAQSIVYKTKETPIVSRQDAFIQNILEIIEREIANEVFGVEELAQSVHMSRSQLYRKIKALTNKTPNAFLREIRLSKAKELLENDAGNVSQIALMVGFSNANYFYKCFKDAYGRTPGEVLKSEKIT